jgi:hypothetical protein
VFALRTYRPRRKRYAEELARYNVVRLRSTSDLDRYLRSL